jgi:hypothetical protein
MNSHAYYRMYQQNVPAIWNKININTINCSSVKAFKNQLLSIVFLNQLMFH